MSDQPTPGDNAPDTDNGQGVKLAPEQLHQIEQAASRLQLEFDGTFNSETIQRFITDSQTRLEHRAKFNTWLPVIIERFTRERLHALARVEHGSTDRPSVLLLCVHNAGRSQMAAGWLRAIAGDQIDVFSGGSDPGFEVNAAAIEAMNEVGIDISNEFPKPWTDEIARAADVIITMGCGDACPIFPGKRYEDWELKDPAGQTVDFVREVRDDIRQRIEALVASLQVSTS
jgi:arsenate reductase (thioredoxin)